MSGRVDGFLVKLVNFVKQIKKTYGGVPFSDLVRHIFYEKHVEILLKADLNNRKSFPVDNNISIQEVCENNKNVLFEFYRTCNVSELYSKIRIEKYFSNCCRCIVAKRNNRFIGHLWWGTNKTRFENCGDPSLRFIAQTFGLRDDDVLAIDYFIPPEERGRGVAFEVMAKAYASLNEQGYNRIFGLVLPHNRPARWTYNLLGHREIERIIVRRFLLNYIVLIGNKLFLSFNPRF